MIVCTITPDLISQAVEAVGGEDNIKNAMMGSMPYNMRGSMFGDAYARNTNDESEKTHLREYALGSKIVKAMMPEEYLADL